MTPDPVAEVDLTYVLSRYPQAISTFINGEVAAVARRVARVSICGLRRTDEPDLRPGGIPARVGVHWTPLRHEPRFWPLLARGLAGEPRAVLDEVRFVAGPAVGLVPTLRWAHLGASAAAEAARLPRTSRGRRHLHAHFAADGAIAAHVIGRLRRIPHSVTVHGSADLFRDNPHLDRLLRDAALVVAVSEFHRRAVLDRVRGLDPDRVAVIGVGVPADGLATLAGTAAPRHDSGHHRIVSVANLGPTKGMPVLVDAVARLVAAGRDVTLEIVGEGPERGEIERRVDAGRLQDRVRLLGRLDPEAAHRVMAGADCFALACVVAPGGAHDGLPTVLMEAMAMGIPTVSTTVSAIPELVVDGVTGRLAPPRDADALAGAIGAVIDDPAGAARLAHRGRALVRERHDQRTNADRLLDAIVERVG